MKLLWDCPAEFSSAALSEVSTVAVPLPERFAPVKASSVSNRIGTGVDDFHNHIAGLRIGRGRGVKRVDFPAGVKIGVVDQLAVEPAFHVFAGNRELDVIPAAGVNVAGLGIQRAAAFDGVLRVAPAADVPPGAVFVAVDAEQNQEAFRAGNFPRLERESVIGPVFVAGERADEFAFRRLPQRAVLRLPIRAVAEQFPALRAAAEIGREQNFSVRTR